MLARPSSCTYHCGSLPTGQLGRLPHATLGWLPTPSRGIATCPNRAIDMMGLTPTGLWPCRLLPVPVPRIGTLTLMGSSYLIFFLNVRTTDSHVPHKSLAQVHTTCMPDVTQTVNRFPLDLSWSSERPPVLTSSNSFRHLISGSLPLISLNLT